ncbi:hypothetical protein VZQ01_21475 [Myxococcus faecalis]|uniref:hypothetical protein n=1 Tax=Myxococcus faecalis TaxID=3115646 RepID=UPI003CF83740
MPLPLIPAAFLLAGLMGYGAKKAYDGIDSMKDAKDLGEEAEARHRDAVQRLDGAREVLQQQLDAQVASIDAAIALLARACTRVEELSGVLGAQWALGGRFDAEDDVHLARFATAMQLVNAQRELMRMPLFADGGDLNTQLETLLEQSRGLLQRETP